MAWYLPLGLHFVGAANGGIAAEVCVAVFLDEGETERLDGGDIIIIGGVGVPATGIAVAVWM